MRLTARHRRLWELCVLQLAESQRLSSSDAPAGPSAPSSIYLTGSVSSRRARGCVRSVARQPPLELRCSMWQWRLCLRKDGADERVLECVQLLVDTSVHFLSLDGRHACRDLDGLLCFVECRPDFGSGRGTLLAAIWSLQGVVGPVFGPRMSPDGG